MRASTALALIALVLLAPVVAAASSAPRPSGTKKADRIDAVYGGTDSVTCGKGVDAVTADLADAISRDCEFVSRRISSDSLTSAGAQHQTQVEPSVAGAGTTAVASFQVGRFADGGAAGIGWSTSADSGRTWRSGILPSLTVASKPAGDAPRASDPAVAYDAAHATWLIATLVLGSNYTGLGISRSNDARSWSAPIFAARFTSNSLAYDKEWVGCDDTSTSSFYGRCYLVYTDIATPRVAVQVSGDGGATWGAPVTVTSAFGIDAEGALPLIQPDGALTVVFEAEEVGIYAVRSIDGGATFGLPQGVSAISEAARPFLRAPPLPTAAVDASGRMYVAWADCSLRAGCSGNTIVLSTSTDGVTWTAPTGIPGTGFDSFVPGLAADPAKTGRLSLVTYIRNSNTCAVAKCTFGVSVTNSVDGGAHWTKPQRLDAVSPH